MHWMIEGERYKIKYSAFHCLFGFDVRDTSKSKIHNEEQLSTNEVDFMYDNRLGEVVYGTTKVMRLFYKYLNRLFRATLALKSGDAISIKLITRNLLARMSNEGESFSVVDFIWLCSLYHVHG